MSGERVQTRQDGPEGQRPRSALEGSVGFAPSTLRHCAWPGPRPGGQWCFSKQSATRRVNSDRHLAGG